MKKNFHEIELLSSYLDGQLNPAELARLEARLDSDPELASALDDIRFTRNILRKLPTRKAPRNFTLTRQMAGLKPPLPRSYSFFRFSTAFATILLVLTFAANSLPNLSFGAAAPAMESANGMGGGCEEPCGEEAFALETEAPAAPEEPSVELTPSPTPEPATTREGEPSADTLQAPKEGADASPVSGVIPTLWQIVLIAVIVVSGLAMWLLRKSAARKWR